MQIVIFDDPDEVGRYAASLVLRGVDDGSLRTLGVATGTSPLPVYRQLAARRTQRWSDICVFALDEYVGLPPDHPESYHAVIARTVTEPLGLDPARVHVPDGAASDLPRACMQYEEAIRDADGVDLQILGIGSTGHIGFNEPSSSLTSRTRVKTLAPQTRRDNARFFANPDDVPVHCITQGLGTIMDSRRVLLVAQGQAKAAAVAAAVEGPVTSMCPGSVLQMHPDATIVVDGAAASQLANADYYRFVFAHRPPWQL